MAPVWFEGYLSIFSLQLCDCTLGGAELGGTDELDVMDLVDVGVYGIALAGT